MRQKLRRNRHELALWRQASCFGGRMLQLVQSRVLTPDPALPEVALHVDRQTLAKRRWRGAAEDGAEFGFELEAPLKEADVFFQTAAARYVIRQHPEPV